MLGLVILMILGIIAYVIYKQYKKPVKFASNIHQYDHAIVIGGSIGGIVSAAHLAKYFKRITIIESDDVLSDTFMKSTPNEILDYHCCLASPTSLERSGVVRELFPQLENKLFNEYDVRNYSLKDEARFFIDGVLLNQNLTEDIDWLGVDRFTLETVLRKELCLQFPNQIEWKCNTRVTQLIVDQSLNLVKGIKCRSKENVGSPSLDVYGDFIVDCTGRNSSSSKWLKEDFNLIVPTEQIHFGCGYVTFIGERFQTGYPLLDTKPVICATVNAPIQNIGCYITPIRKIPTPDENSLGTLSTIAVHCVNAEYAPNDSYENLLEWVKEHLNQEFYSILKSTKAHSPLVPYHRPIDDRKYVESLGKKWPQNYILLGDAMCTFNRRASAISEECWLSSTANDWKTPILKIIKTDKNGKTTTCQRDNDSIATKNNKMKVPLMIQILQWYNYWFLQCATNSGQLSTDFLHVVNQNRRLFILMKPTTVLTVFHMALRNYFNLSKK